MDKKQWLKTLLIVLISSIIKQFIPSNFEWILGYITGMIVWDTIWYNKNE